MAQNITIMGASYSDVPAVTLPKTGGGTASFDDTTDANATAAEIAQGKTAYVNGSKVVGSATSRTSSDLTVSGATVTAPAGYYASQASKTVASGSVTAPSSISGAGATLNFTPNPATFHMTKDVSITPNVTTAGYISAGTAGTSSVSLSAQATGLVNSTITPSTTDISIAANGAGAYWVTASAKVAGDADLVAENIKKDVSIFGVTGTYEGSGATLQAKTNINPTTSSQTITPDTGYDGLSSVQINAMPNGMVVAPAMINDRSATVSTGTNTLTLSKIVLVTPTVITAGYISSGSTGNSAVSLTANVTTKAAATITPSTTDQTIASGTYLTGTQTIAGDANLVPANIAENVTIFGVTGTHSGQIINNQQKSVTPTESAQTVTPDTGYTGLSEVSVGAISSTYVGSGITRRDSDDIDSVGETGYYTVQIPNGYYAEDAEYKIRRFSLPTATSATHTGTSKISGGITPGTANQYLNINSPGMVIDTASYYQINGDANLIPQNIANGVSIFGVTGTHSGGYTLLGSLSLGTISTSSTTATDTGKSITVQGINNYDLLVCECSVATITNGRHAATTRLIWLTSSSDIATKSTATILGSTLNIKVSSSGVATSRASATTYGVYAYACSLSDGSATISIYQRYNSTQTGTINGSYTMRVYGVKIYDLIGG